MKLRLAILCIGVCFVLATAGAAHAASMEAANGAYQSGDYKVAIENYEALVKQGIVHEDLYYNLANAYYRSAQLGPALFNYERALRVAPEQEDFLYNYKVAKEAVAERGRNRLHGAEGDAWWVRLSVHFSITSTTVVLVLCNALFFAGLILLRFLVPGLLRTAIAVSVVSLGSGTVASGLLLAGHTYADEKIHNGIVVADLAIMREGPNASLEERGQLHPGLRVTVLANDEDWLLVRLANGVEGWVPKSTVGLFHK